MNARVVRKGLPGRFLNYKTFLKRLDSISDCNVIMYTSNPGKFGGDMLKIGELAKICGVSVQTLRYYDKVGVLCADTVDTQTGYRYYHPEKVKVYQMIEHLKSLEFSLDEIREFLRCPYAEQCRMYREKKSSLLEAIRQKQGQIQRIDSSCEIPESGVLPVGERILQIPFVDDPEVIGKWIYCGNRKPTEIFDGESTLTRLPVLQESLYFLPGGGHVWMYFWTKGILYVVLNDFNVIVPNNYRIFMYEGRTYMEIDWLTGKFGKNAEEDLIRIYRQENSNSYTESETHPFRDEVNLPFHSDPRVLGVWETVDVIRSRAEYTHRSGERKKKSFWIEELKFHERGVCSKTLNINGSALERRFQYTAGILIDRAEEHAEHYWLHAEEDADYLILEHKSGDYSHTGKVLVFYVFRRKSQDKTEEQTDE